MTNELKQHTRWAQRHAGAWWTVALSTPVKPELLAWLTQTYEVEKLTIVGDTVALLVRSTRGTVRHLMELPKPKGQGSKHEVNQISW